MFCSNLYWLEMEMLPGLGPRGGGGSSTTGAGLGLRCTVDDLGPVGAIAALSGSTGKIRCPKRIVSWMMIRGSRQASVGKEFGWLEMSRLQSIVWATQVKAE